MNDKFETVIQGLLGIFPGIKEVLVVYLYGSVARKDYSLRHSDLDLLIVINSKSVPEKLKQKIDKKIIPIGLKNKVRTHIEYQGTKVREQDQTLIRKMVEEGKILYSSGVFTFDYDQIGLGQFLIYSYSALKSKRKTTLSKALHGRMSWYYKGKKKIVKEYTGLIDGRTVIPLGNGVLMVAKKKQQDIERVFEEYGAEYTIRKVVYA